MTTMNCKTIQSSFDDRLDHRLDAERVTAFDAHLSACDDCRHQWDRYRAAWDLAGELPDIEPSVGFAERTLRRLAEDDTVTGHGWWGGVVLRRVLLASAAAAIVLAGWLGSQHLRQRTPSPQQATIEQQLELYAAVRDDEYLDDFDVITYLHLLKTSDNGDSES